MEKILINLDLDRRLFLVAIVIGKFCHEISNACLSDVCAHGSLVHIFFVYLPTSPGEMEKNI